jgi:hypothetical protein
MKYKIFLFLVVVAIVMQQQNNLRAQIWAPQGAEWYYGYSRFGISGYVKITYSDDTLISENVSPVQYHNCQKLIKTDYSYNHINSILDTVHIGDEYTYSNEDTVFLYKYNHFYVLYDFSAQPGDSWFVPPTYGDICDSLVTVTVVSTGDTIINSEELRYFVVDSYEESAWMLCGLVIEKIGPVDRYMLPEQNCFIDLEEGGPLRCYNDDDFQYVTGIASSCDYIPVGINEADNDYFEIYPNPAVNTIRIDCPPGKTYHLILRNLMGASVLESSGISNGMSINISGFTPGIYILYLIDYHSNILKTKLQILKN